MQADAGTRAVISPCFLFCTIYTKIAGAYELLELVGVQDKTTRRDSS